jgi:hypothetical protein
MENLDEDQAVSLLQILRHAYPFLVFRTASVPIHLQFCLVLTSQVQVLVLESQWSVAELRHLPDSQVTPQPV